MSKSDELPEQTIVSMAATSLSSLFRAWLDSNLKNEDVLSMCDESIFDRRRYNEARSEDATWRIDVEGDSGGATTTTINTRFAGLVCNLFPLYIPKRNQRDDCLDAEALLLQGSILTPMPWSTALSTSASPTSPRFTARRNMQIQNSKSKCLCMFWNESNRVWTNP